MTNRELGLPILRMQIRTEPDVVSARQRARRIAELLNFDHQDQARIATAISELSRNVFQYAKAGSVEFFFDVRPTPQVLFVRVSDSGPGIKNLDLILSGQYVSQTGMGVGLGGSKKLMDSFQIESEIGIGTKVTVGKILGARAPVLASEHLGKVAAELASGRSDTPFQEVQRQNRDLLTALDELGARKDELSELNRELAETNRGVVALYAELDEKASALQRANEVKTSFLSNMTHEFRTPLSSIISLTRILLDRIDGELTVEQEKQVTYIRKSSEGLLELVNDLLDLAKVEAGKIRVSTSEFHLEELLGGLRGMFRPLITQNNSIQFTVDWDPALSVMMTDQAKVSQILRNLISNSMKYTENGLVQVYAEPGPEDTIVFTVSDTGIGIQPEHLKSVFEDFSQIDSKLQKMNKGTGLGLPLSRKLTRLLGGDLWVESVIGLGSKFTARVPRVYSGDGEVVLFDSKHEPDESENPTKEKFRILLVDDDEPSRYIIKGMISTELDAIYHEVQSGDLALSEIRQWKPHLVILDLTMPEIDGFAVLEAVKSNPEYSDLPVIVNTARKLSAYEQQVFQNYGVASLSKERVDHDVAMRELRLALKKAGFDYHNPHRDQKDG